MVADGDAAAGEETESAQPTFEEFMAAKLEKERVARLAVLERKVCRCSHVSAHSISYETDVSVVLCIACHSAVVRYAPLFSFDTHIRDWLYHLVVVVFSYGWDSVLFNIFCRFVVMANASFVTY